MQEVGGGMHSPAAGADADVEACCGLLAQLLVDMWQRAGQANSFPLASLLLQRWASLDDMVCKPSGILTLQGIAIAQVLIIVHDALRQYTVLSSAIKPPRGEPGWITQGLQRWADVCRLMPRASMLVSLFRLLSSGTTGTQARAFDIIQSLALLVTAPARSIADDGPALQEWTRLLLVDLLHTLAQVRGRGMCHESGHLNP